MIRLYVFDADDTLRRTLIPGLPCPHGPDDWELLPGVRERMAELPDHAMVAVASNQDHVGYGLISGELCEELLRELVREASSGRFDPLVAFCPHVLDEECACRKPAPGMLLELMRSCGVDPEETLFVGDAPSDAEAASRAGVRFAWAGDFFR